MSDDRYAHLHELQRRCERATTEGSAATLRWQARRYCERAGIAVPSWASTRPTGKKTSPVVQGTRDPFIAGPREDRGRAAQDQADAPTAPKPRGAKPPAIVTRMPREAHPDAVPVTLPPELSRWRAMGEGRVVHVGQAGVVLHAMGERPRSFGTVAAALAAIDTNVAK